MAAEFDGEASGCTFQWKIESISQCWWLEKGVRILSPKFITDALEGTEWTLRLYPMRSINHNEFALFLYREKDCNGPNLIDVNFQFKLLGKDDSVLIRHNTLKHNFMKHAMWGNFPIGLREKIFCTERKKFLPADTLTVQCTIWIPGKEPVKSNHLFATTGFKVKQRSFVWKINRISTLKSGLENKFKDSLINFDANLNESLKKMNINMLPVDENTIYISCKVMIINSEGKKITCGIYEYFESDLKNGALSATSLLPTLMENKSSYLCNDVLSFEFEFSIIIYKDCKKKVSKLEDEHNAGKEEPNYSTALMADLKNIYKDGIFSDTELRTSTQIFPAHKVILSARSPVFKSMLSNDMKEKNSGHIDITDFEDDTIHRVLLYMYTDSLEDMQFESAFGLYKIADKYQILSLKSRCTSFLKEYLSPANACEVLILADLCSDDDLKSAVQDYMLGQSKPFFSSQEWKEFMKTHMALASDIMYRKLFLE